MLYRSNFGIYGRCVVLTYFQDTWQICYRDYSFTSVAGVCYMSFYIVMDHILMKMHVFLSVTTGDNSNCHIPY